MALLFMGVSFLGVRLDEGFWDKCGRIPAWVGKLVRGELGGSEDGITGVSFDGLRRTVL